MAIRRNISLLSEGIVAEIDIVYRTDLVPIEFFITDYVIPNNAIATLYCITSADELFKAVGMITNNIISFELSAGFFTVGRNCLQIRIAAEEKELYSFEVNVSCKRNIASDDAQEVESQPTLVTQLLTEVANTKGYVNEALLEVERPNIDSSYNGVATERIEPVLPINEGDTLKDILSTLTQIANNEEYNYALIDEEKLNETVYSTLGEAIKRMTLRLFNLEALASKEVRFPWATNDARQWLRFYRVGPVVIVNCALITYFNSASSYDLIPVGYRPIVLATANLSLPNSASIIGSATVTYRENGTVNFRTSTSTTAEYYHTLAWITADEFPYDDASVG